MSEFEFKHDGLFKARIDDCDNLSIWLDPSGTRDYWEMYDENFVGPKASCIRGLLARDTEREAIFAEAIEYARGCIHPANERSHAELDALAARWQATSGATGAEGQG